MINGRKDSPDVFISSSTWWHGTHTRATWYNSWKSGSHSSRGRPILWTQVQSLTMADEPYITSRTHKKRQRPILLKKKKKSCSCRKNQSVSTTRYAIFVTLGSLQNEWTKDSHMKTKKCKDNALVIVHAIFNLFMP